MADQKALIQAMGLSELDTDNDTFIKHGKDFPTRKKLQGLVLKSTIPDSKPDGPQLWATEKTPVTAAGQTVKCHMQVTVVSISATIPRGNTDGSDIDDIPKENFLPRELASEWSLEKLFYSNSNPEKPHKGIFIAAPTNVYDYSDYWRHVPSNIRNAVPTFTQKFLNKYSTRYTTLRAEHISVSFISFKCNLPLDDNDWKL